MTLRSLLLCVLTLCVLTAWAGEFQPIGFESIGMGGAGVANARGSMAGYYNPALLAASPNLVEVTVGGGLGVREFNLADNIDKLSNLDLSGAIARIAANGPAVVPPLNVPIAGAAANSAADRANVVTAQGILTAMGGQNNSLALMPSAELAAQVRNLGIGVFLTSDAGAQAVVDPAYVNLIVKKTILGTDFYLTYNPATDQYTASNNAAPYNSTSLEYGLNNKKTYLKLRGLATVEVPISYARRLPVPVGTLAVGVSVKAMSGTTYNADVKIDTESGDVSDQLTNNDKTSTAFGVDAGLLFIPPAVRNLRFGLVGKNLNKPKFDMSNGGSVEANSMIRAGMAMDLTKKVNFAADLDLSKNTRFDGTPSQYVGGGVNLHPNNSFSFRLGAMKNLKSSEDGLIITGGLGIGFKALQLDLSAQAATKSGEYKGDSIPRYARLNLALVSRW